MTIHRYRAAGMDVAVRTFVLCLTLVAAAACATPDVKPFAVQTGELLKVQEQEFATIEDRLAKAKTIAPQAVQSDIDRQLASIAGHRQSLSVTLGKAVSYSQSLVSLAEAGETGADGVKQLSSALKSLSFDATTKLATALASPVAEKLAEVVSRVQAQTSLLAAAKEADPGIQLVACLMGYLYDPALAPDALAAAGIGRTAADLCADGGVGGEGKDKAKGKPDYGAAVWARLVEGVYGHSTDPIPDYATSVLIVPYQEANDVRSELLAMLLAGDGDKDDIERLAFLNAELERIGPRLTEVTEIKAELAQWRTTRLRQIPLMLSAYRAWAREHARLIAVLEKNTGFLNIGKTARPFEALELKGLIDAIKASRAKS